MVNTCRRLVRQAVVWVNWTGYMMSFLIQWANGSMLQTAVTIAFKYLMKTGVILITGQTLSDHQP